MAKKKKQPFLEELEDVSMRLLPAVGGMVGGLCAGGILTPSLLSFCIGGAIGGGITFGLLHGFFILVNPKRERRKNV